MVLEINKLIDSNHSLLRKLGLLLYSRNDQDGGLDVNELDDLLRLINEDEIERIYVKGFNDGFDEGSEY